MEQCRNNSNFLSHLVTGDEAAFAMNESVNTRNTIYYAYKGNRPDHFYEKPESREKVSVWDGLCGNRGLIGPYFFQGNVNSASY